MRLISLLLALLLIGFLVIKQLDSSSSNNKIEEVLKSEDINAPKVPSSPKDLREFDEDINKFIQDNADKRAEELDKLERQ